MIVFKSAVRPRMIPLVKDPFEGRLRVALGRAKARRVAVSLARISEASAPPPMTRRPFPKLHLRSRSMAKAKTKAAGTNLPVPQNDGDAEQLVARLGVLRRENDEAKAAHDAVVAALEEKRGIAVKVFKEVQGVILDALNIWATAHRERLTNGGRTKTVRLPTGSILWRDGKYAVNHRGLKNDDVVRAVQDRIAALEAEIATAKSERRRKDVLALLEKVEVLEGFIRVKSEPNKDAMLAAREVAETIPGVTVPRGAEEFVVEPLASQIGEVASS